MHRHIDRHPVSQAGRPGREAGGARGQAGRQIAG